MGGEDGKCFGCEFQGIGYRAVGHIDGVPPFVSPLRPDPDLRKCLISSPDHASPTVERISKRFNDVHSDSPMVQVCALVDIWLN